MNLWKDRLLLSTAIHRKISKKYASEAIYMPIWRLKKRVMDLNTHFLLSAGLAGSRAGNYQFAHETAQQISSCEQKALLPVLITT